MTMHSILRARARLVALVPGVALGVAAAFVAAPLAASSLGAQDIPIPMVTIPKAAAKSAVAATNAHTAAMQSVSDETPTATGSAAPIQTGTRVRTTTMTPITTSAPRRPQAPQSGKTVTTVATPASSPMKPVLSVASSPVTPGAAKTATVKGAPAAKATPGAKGMPAVSAAPAAATASAGGPDSGASSISVSQRGIRGEVSLNREAYSYDPGARRDPFVSLMRSGDLRPLLSDLRLVTVLYDPTGRNSIAVMHDLSTKDQYRVRVGQTLGRMRVAQIQPKHVVFTIEEVGFSRQEALALGDTTKARTQ
jgi:hypothetical protein